jgi:YVTN family beta-propeller protein
MAAAKAPIAASSIQKLHLVTTANAPLIRAGTTQVLWTVRATAIDPSRSNDATWNDRKLSHIDGARHDSLTMHKTVAAMAVLLGVFQWEVEARAQPPRLEVQEVAATGCMPKGASLSPDGKRFYVTNFGQENTRNITVYDAKTLALVDTINVPGVVVESVLSHDGKTIYASNFRRHSVQYIDVTSKTVTREITTGMHPKILALSSDGKMLFAANWAGNSVTQIDVASGTVVRTLPTGVHPRGTVITKSGTLFVANFDGASIDVYPNVMGRTPFDPAAHQHLAACQIPRHLALSPDESKLYISCFHDSSLHVMDVATKQITHRIPIGNSPKSVEASKDGRFVYSADYGKETNSVSVVDTSDWTARVFTIPGMDRGSGVSVMPDGQHALVTGWYDNHVYLVGFRGTGGHPHEAMSHIQSWINNPHHDD